MTEEKISSETIEIIVEEITKAILERLSTGELEIGLGYHCTGKGYICRSSYTCTSTRKHSCTGEFECSDVHYWKVRT